MAGSISKKVRGLNDKNRAYLEIVLKRLGLWFDNRKVGGLFCN